MAKNIITPSRTSFQNIPVFLVQFVVVRLLLVDDVPYLFFSTAEEVATWCLNAAPETKR